MRDSCLLKANPYPFAPTLKSSRNRINIVLLIDIVRTLVDVIIADPIRIDLVSHAALSRRVATIIMTQTKDGLYHNKLPTDMFLFLVVEVFGCFTPIGGQVFLSMC